MSNWMESEVHIIGPADEIARFRATHIRKDENGQDELDFETIIPMPPQLKDYAQEAPSNAYVWALGGELYAPSDTWRRIGKSVLDETPLEWPWVRTLGVNSREGLLQWAEKNRADELADAKRAMEAERATGYRDWYDWQIDNWGCSCGCSAFEWLSDDQTIFYMMTPWTAPEPIFRRLVELFPTLTFTCHFVEENVEADWTHTYAA